MLIGCALATIQGIWNLFSNEPLFPYVAKTVPLWPRVILFLIFCGITIFGIVLLVKVLQRTSKIIQNEKVKPSLRVVVNRVKLDNSAKTGWVVFSVSMTLEPSGPIQLGKLDFDYSPELSIYPLCPAMKGPYPPLGGLPTILVERIESYEVKYEVPGKYGTLLIEQGVLEAQKAPDSKWPQAYIHVMAGGLDFTTEPFLVPTPKRQLTPDKEGSQT